MSSHIGDTTLAAGRRRNPSARRLRHILSCNTKSCLSCILGIIKHPVGGLMMKAPLVLRLEGPRPDKLQTETT
jgi:hypothetical protein